MKPDRTYRRLKPRERWQENDLFRVSKGIYAEIKYHNTPVIGALIGETVHKQIGYRKRL